MSARRWIVTQIGSREHYACPVGFERRGTLARFYTDIWAGPALRALGQRYPQLRGITGRWHPELPEAKVKPFNLKGLFYQQQIRRGAYDSNTAIHLAYDRIGAWFAGRVRDDLGRRPLDPRSHILYSFSTGALETLRFAKDVSMPAVVNQLDPARTDQDLIAEEARSWPGWQAVADPVPESYFDRLREEWRLADLVAVNSEFSRRALVSQGVPAEKLFVVPLTYEPEVRESPVKNPKHPGPLKVLWLGQVVLRKGIPYLFEAGRILARRGVAVEVLVAGIVIISDQAARSAPTNVKLLGRVPREKALELYATSDVFVLPTISDGFAITQLEAMSFGLPVITTPNCGDVVSDGVDGYIIPIRSPEALADRIQQLAEDRAKLAELQTSARLKSKLFTLDRYTSTIEAATAGL